MFIFFRRRKTNSRHNWSKPAISKVRWKQKFKVGGLDLSRRDLDRDLDLDVKKKSVSTVEIFSTSFKNWSRRSLDTKKKSVSTVEKISTSFKNWSRRDGRSRSRSRLVSTVETPKLKQNTFIIFVVDFLGGKYLIIWLRLLMIRYMLIE